jgi:hypothetical protein
MQYAPLDVERDAAECGYALYAEQIGLVHILDGDHHVMRPLGCDAAGGAGAAAAASGDCSGTGANRLDSDTLGVGLSSLYVLDCDGGLGGGAFRCETLGCTSQLGDSNVVLRIFRKQTHVKLFQTHSRRVQLDSAKVVGHSLVATLTDAGE